MNLKGGLKAYIYPNDTDKHHFPHTHIILANNEELIINLLTLDDIEQSRDFPNKLIKYSKRLIKDHINLFVNKWIKLNPQQPIAFPNKTFNRIVIKKKQNNRV